MHNSPTTRVISEIKTFHAASACKTFGTRFQYRYLYTNLFLVSLSNTTSVFNTTQWQGEAETTQGLRNVRNLNVSPEGGFSIL